MKTNEKYVEFLKAKVTFEGNAGFEIKDDEIHPLLKEHQRAIVKWAVLGGRRAIFAAFGLGKSIIQLECVRLTLKHAGGGMGLIVCPLGVRQEFIRDAGKIGLTARFIRSLEETAGEGIYLTNYESVRDGKLDVSAFKVVSLDEASCLRGFGGTKTFRELMRLFEGKGTYRFVATATPSPNEYIELLAYSCFLDIMDVSQAKTRFFKRDSTKADCLTLHPHKEREFWLWLATWAIFVQKPSDLGFSDEGYELPALEIFWHEVDSVHADAGHDRNGQGRIFSDAALGVVDAAREKRNSLPNRIKKIREIIEDTLSQKLVDHRLSDQPVIWCDLNIEQEAIETLFKRENISYVSLYGNQSIDERDVLLEQWRKKEVDGFVSKPTMYGAGINLQQAHTMIFAGIGFKFYEVIQALHREYRYLQEHSCQVHFIYTDAEREIRRQLERKWTQHKELVEQMSNIIREFGLSQSALSGALKRALGTERIEVNSPHYKLVNSDCVIETKAMKDNSVGLVLTSIPFSTQYEYSPNYADFGHTDDNDHFFRQMDFLTPNLLRVLKPGRIAAIHVKDRIVPGGMTGLGFQTTYPFHCKCVEHYTRHGFAYMGMKTIVTDVVRENNQTYRLGWSEQCKDGTKMGVGMPEYLLLFRKPPTSTEKSYADEPVVKSKSKYSRSRWQIDAHGFTRSSGNRLLNPDELGNLPHNAIFKMFREYSLTEVYDFEYHVRLGEAMEEKGMLPVTFMLLQPASWSPEVYTDITRMLTLNGAQSAKGREGHLCPMQFDLADRVIAQMSNEGDVVLDPFGGLMTVPYRAVMQKRFGYGIELSHRYFLDGCSYCEAASRELRMPALFDVDGPELKAAI